MRVKQVNLLRIWLSIICTLLYNSLKEKTCRLHALQNLALFFGFSKETENIESTRKTNQNKNPNRFFLLFYIHVSSGAWVGYAQMFFFSLFGDTHNFSWTEIWNTHNFSQTEIWNCRILMTTSCAYIIIIWRPLGGHFNYSIGGIKTSVFSGRYLGFLGTPICSLGQCTKGHEYILKDMILTSRRDIPPVILREPYQQIGFSHLWCLGPEPPILLFQVYSKSTNRVPCFE